MGAEPWGLEQLMGEHQALMRKRGTLAHGAQRMSLALNPVDGSTSEKKPPHGRGGFLLDGNRLT